MIFGNGVDDTARGWVGNGRIWILPALLVVLAATLMLPSGVGEAAAQDADKKPFVTTWRVDAAGGNVTIPVGNATGTYTISWGGREPSTLLSPATSTTHTRGSATTRSAYTATLPGYTLTAIPTRKNCCR